MNWETFIESKIIENLGWTLIHSLWQTTLVACGLFLFLRAAYRFSAHTRYVFSIFALLLAVSLPIFTYISLSKNSVFNTFGRFDSIGQSSKKFAANPNLDEKLTDLDERRALPEKSTTKQVSLTTLRAFFDVKFDKLLPFLVGAWLFGITIFSIRLLGGVWQLRRFRTSGVFEVEDDWKEKVAALCCRLRIRRTVEILQSNLIETPFATGWLKPLILIPAGLFLQMNPRELETILAHELVHIRRHDFFISFAQSLAEVLFFYHPGVWWISACVRREREFACDDRVMKILATSRIDYAKALMNLEQLRNKQLSPLIATAANGGLLVQRIQKITQKNTEINAKLSAWSAGLALVLISAILLALFWGDQTAFVNAESAPKTKKLAVGFVSIPPVDRTINAPKDAEATARLMIAKLAQYKIPAIGFLIGASVSDGEKLYPARAEIVRLWRDAGLELGVGNYRHVWFYDTPYEDYVAGVEKNERVAKQILAESNARLRYFSYPFLNTGKTSEDRNRFEAWLAARGLTPVKYTIDNQEWMYSYAYDQARNNNDVNEMKRIRQEFVNYMTKMFDHFEAYSNEMFGRDINQTMVLTPSRLVADSADELFGMIEKRGYQFVSMDEALKDAAFQTKEAFVESKSGISWFERWQMAQGKKLRLEPQVDADIQNTWNKKPKG